MEHISELRRDLVSGDWVAVATGRAKRPGAFKQFEAETPGPKAGCPFEDPQGAGNSEPLLAYDLEGRVLGEHSRGDWFVQAVRNKFPAFGEGQCDETHEVGPYTVLDGVGSHEVVITRDHERHWGRFTQPEGCAVMKAYHERYVHLLQVPCVRYVSLFHNHGRAAGASVWHPHSQIIAVPVIPPDVGRSFDGSRRYWSENKLCVHCAMMAWEIEDKHRVVFENEHAIAFCPFVSRTAFEVRIFPKRHEPFFERSTDSELADTAEALRQALGCLADKLNEPAYNFFVHTAPSTAAADYAHYHWHIEILPKTQIWAGFELGTGIEISTISPEAAAAYLRGEGADEAEAGQTDGA